MQKLIWVILWGCWALLIVILALLLWAFSGVFALATVVVIGALPIPIVDFLNRKKSSFTAIIFLALFVIIAFVCLLFLGYSGLL